MYTVLKIKMGINLSLIILLLCLSGLDCLPVQKRSSLSDSSQQPAWCRETRPRSSQTSPCNEDEKVRRHFLHESNPKGCKKFGICPIDAAKYDNQTEYNYFLTFEDCQRECMEHVLCPELPLGENMVVTSDNALQGWGRRVVFECTSGYSLSDNSDKSIRTCQKNGTWSGVAPICLKQCSAPPPVRRAQIAPSKDQHNQGGTVHYTCDVGYELRGDAQRTCGPNGEWVEAEPSCGCQGQVSDTDECTSCPEPSPVEHGNVLAPYRSLYAEIEYTCYEGYTMVGSQTRVCEEDGTWSGDKPTCWRMIIVKEGVDVTDKVVEVAAGSTNIKFTAKSSKPNPFEGTEPQWSFSEGAELPFAVEQSEFCLTFTSILKSKEQRGNYSISIGNFTTSFQLNTKEPEETPETSDTDQVAPSVVVLSDMVQDNNAQFVCVISGIPIPRIQWFHNSKLVTSNERTIMENYPSRPPMTFMVSILKIFDLNANDSGSYRCVGDNVVDSASSVVELHVAEIQKRSIEDSAKSSSLCDSHSPNTVTLLGQVKAQVRQVRSSDMPTYRVQVKRFLRGSDTESSSRRVRTVVVDADPQEERLRSNTDYIFQGRLIDRTLFVSRHSVLRHTSELESQIKSSSC